MTVRPLPKESAGVFQWGHVFQRGDLPIYISDPSGNPASPQTIHYTLFYYPKRSDCAFQAGPSRRTPVTAGVGSFYVSGIAGECGQPGRWYVQWDWQEADGLPWSQDFFGFRIFDSSCDFKPWERCCPRYPGCGCGDHHRWGRTPDAWWDIDRGWGWDDRRRRR